MRSLPLGTAYAVWTGIGALGAFVVGRRTAEALRVGDQFGHRGYVAPFAWEARSESAL